MENNKGSIVQFKFGLKQFVPMTLTALSLASAASAATAYINQVGYRTSDSKEFTLLDGTGAVEILDGNGQTVLTATPSAPSVYDASGQSVSLVSFSDLKTPGTYSIKVGGQVIRDDLKIMKAPFEDLAKASLKFFYFQRASMAIEAPYADQWVRAAGHTSSTAKFHESTGKSGTWESSGGWYDAGDYGRYIVNSGITTYTLLSLYEHFPEYFKTLKWNIPANGVLPDLLAEIKYNLAWMLTMQDTDGGVFHKLTTLQHAGEVMPANDNGQMYVIQKGTTAACNFAAVMAAAYRVYKSYDETFANKCLKAAKDAYAWVEKNPNVIVADNPSGVGTGHYRDQNVSDEILFAKSQMFITTGDASYKPAIEKATVPDWRNVAALAAYGNATYGADEASKKILTDIADKYVTYSSSGFGVVISKYDFEFGIENKSIWGTNSMAANQGILLLHAYYLTSEKKYYDAAVKALDYLLGKNPMNTSYVTAYGTTSPKTPHHRISTNDGIKDPIPGMLVGGPSIRGDDRGACPSYINTSAPALSYIDNQCSYVTNEVAINWNAALAYLAGALEALNAGYTPSFATEGIIPSDKTPDSDAKPDSGKDNDNSDAIVKPLTGTLNADQPRIKFKNQMIYVEKGGKQYNLNGHLIK